MMEIKEDSIAHDMRTDRERMLEDKVGSRTLLVILISLLALIEAIIIVRLAF